MRILFLVPDLPDSLVWRWMHRVLRGSYRARRLATWVPSLVHGSLLTPVVWGGTLNIMRHARLAKTLGADVLLCSPQGKDTYGKLGITDLAFVRWRDRRADDLVVVPDMASELIDQVVGPVVGYMQAPIQLRPDFDYMCPRVRLWTDSPFMLAQCRTVFPGKDIPIVPNIVDASLFPFIEQSHREPGLLFAFPRKGKQYIHETEQEYRRLGGKYWRFELIDGLSIHALAERMRRPQAFLASAESEGCALPPQECMAAGIVVVGKSARDANFSMVDGETAMVAETPLAAAQALKRIEDPSLRDCVTRAAYQFISRYFPEGEPTKFWLDFLSSIEWDHSGRGNAPNPEGPDTDTSTP